MHGHARKPGAVCLALAFPTAVFKIAAWTACRRWRLCAGPRRRCTPDGCRPREVRDAAQPSSTGRRQEGFEAALTPEVLGFGNRWYPPACKLFAGKHKTKVYPTTAELIDFGRRICGISPLARVLKGMLQR